jgi:hypothetical protein
MALCGFRGAARADAVGPEVTRPAPFSARGQRHTRDTPSIVRRGAWAWAGRGAGRSEPLSRSSGDVDTWSRRHSAADSGRAERHTSGAWMVPFVGNDSLRIAIPRSRLSVYATGWATLAEACDPCDVQPRRANTKTVFGSLPLSPQRPFRRQGPALPSLPRQVSWCRPRPPPA